MRRTRSKRKAKRNRQKRTKGRRINVKKIILLSLLFFSVLFLIYSFIVLSGIRSRDILAENIANHRFLSVVEDDMEKTVYIFERETGAQRGISDVYVFLHNERKENSVVIYLPGSLYFSGLEDDFGSPIPISSLRYAGDYLQEGRGVEYALWQLNNILGFKVDNYVWITSEAFEVINEVYGSVSDARDRYREDYTLQRGDSLTNAFLRLHTMSSNYSVLRSAFNVSQVRQMDRKVYSNLSFLGAMGKVGSFQRIVGRTNTSVLNLGSAIYSSEEFAEQGGSIRILDTPQYDKTLRGYYLDIIDRDLERERVRIEVYNGSRAPGMAGIYARKILNNGCDVVRFGNAPESLERTQVYVSDDDEFRNSLAIVEEVLLGRFERLEERPSFMTTGDIVILLGEDILQLEMF